MELWKTIQDFPNYEVSNFGRVKSKSRLTPSRRGVWLRPEKILSPGTHRDGYLYVYLYKDDGKIKKKKYIHQLVAENFVSNALNYTEVNHKDGNKKNNYASNLEWCNRSMNIKHAFDNGLEKPMKGSNNPVSKKVIQLDMENNIIKIWNCIAEAEKSLNITGITRCCRGRSKTAGGFRWCYYNGL